MISRLVLVAVVMMAVGCAWIDRESKAGLAMNAARYPHQALKGQGVEQLEADRIACADQEAGGIGAGPTSLARVRDPWTWTVPFGGTVSDLVRYKTCMEARGYAVGFP